MEVDGIYYQKTDSCNPVLPDRPDGGNEGVKHGREQHDKEHVDEQEQRTGLKKRRISQIRVNFQPVKTADESQIEDKTAPGGSCQRSLESWGMLGCGHVINIVKELSLILEASSRNDSEETS